jgi:FMN phosphatase YigB (HAD superfamily)
VKSAAECGEARTFAQGRMSIRRLAKIERIIRGEGIELVSIDAFDTLLRRDRESRAVTAESVRHLHGLFAEAFGEDTPGVELLLEHRRAFEYEREMRARGERVEWSLEDWLRRVGRDFGVDVDRAVEFGLRAELAAEAAACRPVRGARDIVALIRGVGLSTVVVSDTWLPEPVLEELLGDNGFRVDGVYTSASRGDSKRNGRIFEVVVSEWEVEPRRALHLGDNFKSDYIRALGAGWKAMWLPRTLEWPRPAPTCGSQEDGWGRLLNCLDGEASEPLHREHPLYRYAYRWLAPVAIIAAVWQWRLFRRYRSEHAFFIAREGRLLMEVYERLSPVLDGSPKLHYVHLSRRAVALCHPDNLLSSAGQLPGKVQPRTVGQYLDLFGLDKPLLQALLDESKLTSRSSWDDAARHTLRAAALRRGDDLRRARQQARQRLVDYLCQSAGQQSLERIALIDSGWAGTIQDAIGEALGDDVCVLGAYLGVSSDGRPPAGSQYKFGLLRDDYRGGSSNPVFKTAGAIRVLELLLSPPGESTTLALRRDGSGEVRPVLADATKSQNDARLDALRSGLLDGVRLRLEQVETLVSRENGVEIQDLEAAAQAGARRFLVYPPRPVAEVFLSAAFDEGASPGEASSLGLAGLFEGLSWYPGLLARYGVGWLQQPLERGLYGLQRWRGWRQGAQ